MIYLDHAATTKPYDVAIGVMADVLRYNWGNPNSTHERGETAKRLLERARRTIADWLNCDAQNIFFTSCASESAAWAMRTVDKRGRRMLINDTEHASVRDFHDYAWSYGEERPDIPFAIVEMLANNETGDIYTNPRPYAKDHPWICDATAAVGHIPVNIKELSPDFLFGSGHKFGAPQGIGFLYVKDPEDFYFEERHGTPPVALACAMAAALEQSCKHMDEQNAKYIHMKGVLFGKLLGSMKGVHINNACENVLDYIANVSIDGVDGKTLALLLSKNGVMVSAGAACTSGLNEPSHVLMSMYGDENRARSAIRISFGWNNTVAEVEQAADKIIECAEFLRGVS